MPILSGGQSQVMCGLGSLTLTSTFAVPHTARVRLTEVPITGVTVVVTQNGSTVFTAPVITPTQIAQQFNVTFMCAVNDAIAITVSSSTPVDLQLNTVKWSASFQRGM